MCKCRRCLHRGCMSMHVEDGLVQWLHTHMLDQEHSISLKIRCVAARSGKCHLTYMYEKAEA